MTKKQRKVRILQVQEELLGLLRKKFPAIELNEVEERSDGQVVLHVFAPYRDIVGIIRQVEERIGDLLLEGLAILIIPHREKRDQRAA